jgi:hypothetical protein
MRTDSLALNCSFRDRKVSLTLNPKPTFLFISATEAIPLPKPKLRAVREHFVVSSIRSREVARAQRSRVLCSKDALKALDFGNGLLGVHSLPISNTAS